MKFYLECTHCIISQIQRVSKLLSLDDTTEKIILQKIMKYLSTADLEKGSPEVYVDAFAILTEYLGEEDIYKQIRYDYNQKILDFEDKIDEMILSSNNPIKIALETSIAGNLLDLAIHREFSMEYLLNLISEIEKKSITIDDSKKMLEDIKKASTLLFLGDNCGEIVLDKLFIKQIKKYNPNVDIYFAVRGKPAVNDVLEADAHQVHMEDYAKIISNGDSCLGTVLTRTSTEFNKIFNSVDLIIAKGQGNFESLESEHLSNIYYLFMAKCPLVAQQVKVPELSIVCIDGKNYQS